VFVKYDEMVAAVAARAGVSRRYADEIILAVLTSLGERLTPDETKDLLAQLPKKYKQHVNAVPNPNMMNADEFVARVAELEGARAPTSEDARTHVAAVFVTLTEAVNAGELRDILEQLSADFAPLLELPAQSVEPSEPEAALESLAEDVTRTIASTVEHVDEAFAVPDAVVKQPDQVGRESARTLMGAITTAIDAVSGSVTSVVHNTRDRALDLVVFAVDGLEAITDRIDDAAEALQERVHEKVGAAR
jgi:uncharacterized protein (DUF2267 family)